MARGVVASEPETADEQPSNEANAEEHKAAPADTPVEAHGGGPAAAAAALPPDPFLISPRVSPDGGFLPPMVSFAQNFEDVILRRVLQDVQSGFYVDLGAWRPVQDSITNHFYNAGWRGVNVEPEPEAFAALSEARPRDINIQCLVGGVERTELFVCHPGTGLSSTLPGHGERFRAPTDKPSRMLPMPVFLLDRLLALREGREIDFLKIDVEGMEAEILGAAAFDAHRPRLIVVEATQPLSQTPNHSAWEPSLLAKGYVFAYFDGLNRMYLRSEDAWRQPRFACPPCCFDNFVEHTFAARSGAAAEATPD